jgi:hypothetical protein
VTRRLLARTSAQKIKARPQEKKIISAKKIQYSRRVQLQFNVRFNFLQVIGISRRHPASFNFGATCGGVVASSEFVISLVPLLNAV